MTRFALPIRALFFVGLIGGWNHQCTAQTVSQFDFNSTASLLAATTGPNATSVNPVTVAPAGVAFITAGCGAPVGMDLTVPGATFDLTHIRIRANFRRGSGEGTGSFFRRGEFNFGFVGGRLRATYRVFDGAPGYTDYTLTTTQNVSTGAFHEYEFNYDNCSGLAQILDNGVVVATNFTGGGRDLYWIGAGDALIGAQVDNACNQTPGYDYVIIGGNDIGCLVLPVEWGPFTGQMTETGVELNWTTYQEKNNDHFLVERSQDGSTFETIGQIPSKGNSDQPQQYQAQDPNPFHEQTFYRIRQVDVEGLESTSEIIQVQTEAKAANAKAFPTPNTGKFQIQLKEMPQSITQVELYNLQGQRQKAIQIKTQERNQQIAIDWQDLSPGVYWLQIQSGSFRTGQKLIVQ